MAKKVKTADSQPVDRDAITLLIADHRRVARLFAEFQNLKGDGRDADKAAIVKLICKELLVHTAIEEEIFYPAVRDAVDDGDLINEAWVEHAGAKNLISQLQAATPGDDLYDARVTVLGEQIEHHVTEEEGSMFPQAKGSGVDTLSLGALLLVRKTELLANGPPSAVEDSGQNQYRGKKKLPSTPLKHPASAPAMKTSVRKKR